MPPFAFFWKYRIVTVVCLVIAAISAVGITKNTAPQYQEIVFLSIGLEQPTQSDAVELWTQANDQMTETIQGWLVDPGFQKMIPGDFSLSVRKQEKQNLLITMTSATQENAKTATTALIQNLHTAITEYNTATKGTVAITHLTQSENTVTPSLKLNIAVGVVGTLILLWLVGSAVFFIKTISHER